MPYSDRNLLPTGINILSLILAFQYITTKYRYVNRNAEIGSRKTSWGPVPTVLIKCELGPTDTRSDGACRRGTDAGARSTTKQRGHYITEWICVRRARGSNTKIQCSQFVQYLRDPVSISVEWMCVNFTNHSDLRLGEQSGSRLISPTETYPGFP
jgi:hypothetical protein